MLQIGSSIADTAKAATEDVSTLVKWGQENAIYFEPAKTEVMHFSNRKLQPSSLPAIRHNEVYKHPEKAVRWLGIWFDQKLSFKVHVDKWVAKASSLTYHLKGLADTQRGPLPSSMRRGLLSCVVPTLLFGTEAWFPGLTRPSITHPNIMVRSGIQHLLDRQSTILLQGIRAVLPTWKTTPKIALYRESGIPPINQLLEAQQLRFAIRLQSLDQYHPLVGRARPPEPIRPARPITNLPRTLRNTPRQAPPCLSFQSRLQGTAATAIENSIANSHRPYIL